jgi:hypothetical protein
VCRHADDGQPLSLAVRGRNVLVAGDPQSGKSWVPGLSVAPMTVIVIGSKNAPRDSRSFSGASAIEFLGHFRQMLITGQGDSRTVGYKWDHILPKLACT